MKKIPFFFLSISLIFIFLLSFNVAFADITYKPLQPIPGIFESSITLGKENSLAPYLNQIVRILIMVATGLAVLVIVHGGVKYTLTDSVTSKGDAKATIMRALQGLLLALGSYMILNTLNPALLSGQIRGLQELKTSAVKAGSGFGSIEAVPDNTTTEGGLRLIYPGDASYPYQPEDPRYGTAVMLPDSNKIVSSPGLSAWGDPSAINMKGVTIGGRQTYFASGEKISDSDTDAGLSATGKLIEGTPTTVGSAASVYYPAGTLIRTNGITYIIDDNNLVKQKDGSFKPANDNLTNNYTIDIYTTDTKKADSVTTRNKIEVLYVPPVKVGSQGVSDIRNNPDKYINQ